MTGPSLTGLAEILGYAFRNAQLLETALAHPSFAHERDGTRGNERLEFLGDAVLDLVIAHVLFELHPDWNEGDLTRTRAGLVNRGYLAGRGRALGLGDWIRLGRTERQSRGGEKDSVLANCFEAVVGAIYLDGGLAAVDGFVRRVFASALQQTASQARDAKTQFQEWAPSQLQETPHYRTLEDSGTDNDEKRFTVSVVIGEQEWGRGVGRSKRLAERAAAESALARGASATGAASDG